MIGLPEAGKSLMIC